MVDKVDVTQAIATMALGSAGEVMLASGDTVRVKVCSGRELPELLTFLSKVCADLGIKLSDTAGIHAILMEKFNDIGFILQLIANYSPTLYLLVGKMSSLETADNVASLDLDDLLKVVIRVAEVNKDFFTRRVLPIVLAAQGRTNP